MQNRENAFIHPHGNLPQPEHNTQLINSTPDPTKRHDLLYNAAVLLYSITIFTIDLSLRLGIAVGIPYLFAVWIAYHAPYKNMLWITAWGCSALTVFGAFFSVSGLDTDIVVINRLLALFGIWGSAFLCWQARTAREELDGRSQQISQIIEHSPTAMLMTDADGTIVMTNAETLQLLGYTRDELVGKPVEALIPQAVRAQHPTLRSNFIAQPTARGMGAGRDLHALRKDGSEVAVEIGLTPIRHHDQIYVLSSIIDISWRKALEADLRTMNNELEMRVVERTEALQITNDALIRSNTDLQQFAYIASHDLQTPLRSISGFVQLLANAYADKLDDQARNWINRTVDNTQRMHTLINDLLSYSRVDSRARAFAPVDMNVLVEEIKQLYETDLQLSGGTITYDTLPTVSGDAAQLTQLLTNLIGNSLKYHSDEPPKVHISAYWNEYEWFFLIRDNGLGIAPKHHDSIFEIFKRLHTNQTYPGTGIGLAICRRVVHRHSGRIWVESTPGIGSTFFFTLGDKQ